MGGGVNCRHRPQLRPVRVVHLGVYDKFDLTRETPNSLAVSATVTTHSMALYYGASEGATSMITHIAYVSCRI
jgi:hypothetical protein